jgi:cobaltochelatase CobT
MATFGRSKVKLWESTLEKVARILSEKYKIKIIFKHDLCMTTGKTIYLPVIPEGASDEFLDACAGFLDHEVSHNLFTEMPIMKEAQKIGKKHGIMLNAVEDPRVEQEMVKLWRGSKVNLRNCREWSLKQLSNRWDELSDFGKLVQSIVITTSCAEDHWFVKDKITPDEELAKRLESIKELTDTIPKIASTREAFELAKQIIDKLKEEEEPEEERSENGEEEEGEGQPSEEELEQDEQLTSTHKQIQEEAKKLQKKLGGKTGTDRYLIYSTENDVIEYITDGDKGATATFLRESRQMVNTIRQKFRLNLLSHTTNRWENGKSRGKIDQQSVYRVVLGTGKDVFRRKVVSPGFDTVASLFIDHSNSMYPDAINLAAMAALVFGEALNDINIPFEIAGYSTGHYHEGVKVYEAASEEERAFYTRWGKLWIGIYKRFDEMWGSTRHRCYQMSRNGKYNTYDGEAVRIAAQRLLARSEKRKILFVFSDGYPCPNVQKFMPEHAAYLKTVAQEIEKIVEVFAIGIKSDSVNKFYTNSVTIDNIRDLPNVVLMELDRLIRRKQHAYKRTA